MNRHLLLLKARAFAVHFGISLAIFFVLLYLVFFHWYPMPFFTTDGGWQGIRIIALVDLVLGPTLTFVIFNPIKKTLRHLKMDLSLIAFVQLAVLSWGIWIVHNERPYLVVFSDQVFYSITYKQYKETGLTEEKLTTLGKPAPIKFFVNIPADPIERQAASYRAVRKAQPIYYLSDLYQPLDQRHLGALVKSGINMPWHLLGQGKDQQNRYKNFTQQHAKQMDQLLFLPLAARYGDFIVAFDKTTFEFVDVLDIPPPEAKAGQGNDFFKQQALAY